MERSRHRGPQRRAVPAQRLGAALAAGALAPGPLATWSAVVPAQPDPAGTATIVLLAVIAGAVFGGALVYLAVRARRPEAAGPLALGRTPATIADRPPFLGQDIDPIVAAVDRSPGTAGSSTRVDATERPVWVRRLDSRMPSPRSSGDAFVDETTGRGDGGAQTIGRRAS